MRPTSVSLTGNGSTRNSDPIPVDWRKENFNLGLAFTTDGSTTGFKVQVSYDDPQGSYATDYNTDASWFDHGSMAAMTADTDGSQTTPVRAVRLQADANGTDTGTLTIVQAG